MQSKKDSRKREKSRDLRLEDILVEEEGIFDEEDEDSVTIRKNSDGEFKVLMFTDTHFLWQKRKGHNVC